jgi:NAD(P)-dependent dehydrogenase (short-subunit alcohol dehydrogenase family)
VASAAHPNLIVPVVADVSRPEDRQYLLDQIGDRRIESLVHLAGYMPIHRIEETQVAEWERLFATHVHGRLYLTLGMLDQLGARSRVIFVGSRSATTVRKGATAYCTSYAASMMLAACLRDELQSHRIAVVNAIPGGVDTALTRHSIAADESVFPDQQVYQADLEAGRLLSPEAVAPFFRWLAITADWDWLAAQTTIAITDAEHRRHWQAD